MDRYTNGNSSTSSNNNKRPIRVGTPSSLIDTNSNSPNKMSAKLTTANQFKFINKLPIFTKDKIDNGSFSSSVSAAGSLQVCIQVLHIFYIHLSVAICCW